MRFSIAVVGALAVAVSAQSSTERQAPSATASIDPAQSSILACVDSCDPGDVTCLSYCNPVPSVTEDDVERTNQCVADCDQGDGSTAASERYAQCMLGCIEEHYYASDGTPRATGAPANNNGNEDDNSSNTSAPTGSPTTLTDASGRPTATSIRPAETSSDGANEDGNDESSASAIVGSSIFALAAALFAL